MSELFKPIKEMKKPVATKKPSAKKSTAKSVTKCPKCGKKVKVYTFKDRTQYWSCKSCGRSGKIE